MSLPEIRILQPVGRWVSHNRDNWNFDTEQVKDLTDKELLTFCRYTPEFGGTVTRDTVITTVSVYTD